MAFTQSEIDTIGLWEELRNNPNGGNGADYTASCTILEDRNNTGYPLLWQSGDDETEEGFEKHQIGVTYAPDERFAYIVCTEKANYSLTPGTFSEVSDEIIVHRVFCAALRPTSADFTFSNPIKNITVSASADTVNLQVIALDELKTVKSTDAITVTHTQDFPCVFGIVYKHKADGEIIGGGSQPEPSETVFRQTFNFRLNNKVNFIHATLDGNGEAFDIIGINFSSLGGFITYNGLAYLSSDGRTEILDLQLKDYEINSYIEQAMQELGGIQNVTSPITIMTTVLGLQSDPDENPVECVHDVVLTVFYKTHKE